MRIPVACVLSIALLAREFPASAAAPDLSEARRRFVAAVHSSDQAVAAAEAALDDLIRKASPLLTGSDQKKVDEMQKALKALKDFKAEKSRILARDLGTYEKLLRAANDYARACQILAAILMVTVAIVVSVVAIVTAAFTFGAGPAAVAAAVAVVAAVLALTTVLIGSLPEILRAMGFREAGDSTDRWLKDNPSLGTAVALVAAVAAVLASIPAAILSLREADAAARDAQKKLQAAPKPVLSRKQLEVPSLPGASFEGELGASFHVKLENGQVARPAGEAALHGTIAISSKSHPGVKLSLEGDATLAAGGTAGAWASLVGHGTARLSGFGGAVTILNATVESQGSSVLALRGGDVAVRGCTHTVQAGSRLSGDELALAGSLRCGSWTLASSTLKLEGGGVSGGGTLSAWSRNFSMSYSASGDGLLARGSISGSDTPWARVPGVAAEFRIEKPKLALRLEGPALSPTFDADGVRVRTTATKPDGSAWSSARLTFPDVVLVPAPPAGAVPVPFPNLPAPGDVFKAAREACEAAARQIPLADPRNAALAVCRTDHPAPPAMPSLPDRLSVPVRDIF